MAKTEFTVSLSLRKSTLRLSGPSCLNAAESASNADGGNASPEGLNFLKIKHCLNLYFSFACNNIQRESKTANRLFRRKFPVAV